MLLDVAVTVSACDSFGPAPMPDRLTVWVPASSAIVTLPIAARVGGSLTAVTVTFTVAVAVPPWLSLMV